MTTADPPGALPPPPSNQLGAGRALGLVVGDVRLTWGLFGLVLAVLVATMQRDLGLFDSAELALVGRQLGLGHPTGQPLHTMLGWLFSHVPLWPPLFGLNLLSALPAALCVVPIMSLAHTLSPDRHAARVPAGLVVLTFLLHAAAWEPATRVEVYALANFFAVWALARLADCVIRGTPQGLLGAGIALGLSASANPFMAVAAALAGLPAALVAARRGLPWFAGLWRIVAGGVVGLLPYLYVFAVAHRTDVFVWEGDALGRYFSGADYGHNRGLTSRELILHAFDWCAASFRSGHLPLLVLGMFGGLMAGTRTRTLGLFGPISLVISVYVVSINVIFYTDNPDYLGYLLLPTACACAGALALFARLRRPALAGVAAVALASLLFVTPFPIQSRTRHLDTVARMLGERLLDAVPEGGVLFVESDHLAFPILYLQRAEGRRLDVVVLVDGLLDSSWYWHLTYAWHPGLVGMPLAGSHADRVRRFFTLHPEREVHLERGPLAGLVGRAVCMGPLILQTRCASDAPATIEEATTALAAELERVQQGSPLADQALAFTGLERGTLLWRQGQPAAGLRAFLAGVPASQRPTGELPDVSRAPSLRRPLPEWGSRAILGHPARNLFVAAGLLDAAGAPEAAAAHVAAAAELGLPEATDSQ